MTHLRSLAAWQPLAPLEASPAAAPLDTAGRDAASDAEIWRLHRQGMAVAEIAAECLTSFQRVAAVLRRAAPPEATRAAAEPPMSPAAAATPPAAGVPRAPAAAEPAKARDFADTVVRLRPRLLGYAISLTRDRDRALDLVQDTMLRALEKQHLFLPGTDLAAWLVTLMRNLHISGLRRAARQGTPLGIEVAEAVPVRGDQLAATMLGETARLLDLLSPNRRRSLVLYGMGFHCDEIAVRLGIPAGSVKSGMVRARAALDRAFGEGPLELVD